MDTSHPADPSVGHSLLQAAVLLPFTLLSAPRGVSAAGVQSRVGQWRAHAGVAPAVVAVGRPALLVHPQALLLLMGQLSCG